MDRTIQVNQDGRSRELTVEEGLQLKTYQAALSGSKPARREILKMIARREQWLASKRPLRSRIKLLREKDPRNADSAMLILGIASRAPQWSEEDPYERYHLEPWAVKAALRRMKAGHLTKKDLDECRRSTRDPDSIDWPESFD